LDDEQQRNLGVLLLDERGSGTGADRPPADSSVSSIPAVRRSPGGCSLCMGSRSQNACRYGDRSRTVVEVVNAA
jgi:hypothetical protein